MNFFGLALGIATLLIIGLGNPLMGDDGIGAAIVARAKGLVVGRNIRPRASSIAIGAQTLAAPVVRQPSPQLAASGSSARSGTGSQSQRGAPVRTSKARTVPRGASTL